MTAGAREPGWGLGARVLVLGFAAGALGIGAYTYGRVGFVEERAHRILAADRATEAEKTLATTERILGAREKELAGRVESLQKRVAEIEAAGRGRDAELLEARTETERLRRELEAEQRRRSRAEREVATLEERIEQERRKGGEGKAPAPKMEEERPAAPAKSEPERLPPRGLGVTAVTDPGQVRKLLDGLNALLAGAGGKEVYKVTAAEAVDGDRLVRVAIEVRGEDGSVVKSFKAGEARFLLSGAAGTLGIKLKDGAVTYGGNRTVPFPDGSYTALLAVDPAPFRASGNPLIAVQ